MEEVEEEEDEKEYIRMRLKRRIKEEEGKKRENELLKENMVTEYGVSDSERRDN